MGRATREYFITRSGLRARIVHDQDDPHPPAFLRRSAVRVFTEGADESERFLIELNEFEATRDWLRSDHQTNIDVENEYRAILCLIALYALDRLDSFSCDAHGNVLITLKPEDLRPILKPTSMQDRDVRVFIARRIYDEVSRRALRDPVAFDGLDCALCGVQVHDFLRGAQILAEEGYLEIGPTSDDAVIVRCRAPLIRDVERYGAPKPDSAAADDLIPALAAYPIAKERLPLITLEYQRFNSASTHAELMSVFKAVAPEVEGLARDVLQLKGAKSSLSNLGLIIQEISTRGLADGGVISQLRYVQKFARDAVEHGEQLPDAVLRMACANAFTLLPQLAAMSV